MAIERTPVWKDGPISVLYVNAVRISVDRNAIRSGRLSL
jgi:hypothetical protein